MYISNLYLGSRLYRMALYATATGYSSQSHACLQAVRSDEGKGLRATCNLRSQIAARNYYEKESVR